jgi:Xaa-Pro aminopeptidase
MHGLRGVLAVAVCVSSLAAEAPREEYRARREAARKSLGDAVLVLFGRTAEQMDPLSNGPLQDPDFYYLTGWTQPGAILMLTPHEEMLFLPAHDRVHEVYTGPLWAATDQDVRGVTGFEKVLPAAQFEAQFSKALESYAQVSTGIGAAYAGRLKRLAPLRELKDAAEVLGPLRAIKSKAEIGLIEHSTNVSVEAHRQAWRRIAPGLFEYQVAATMTYAMLDRGCESNAYDPIVGSGPNGIALHYRENSRRMEAGELVLMDVGAQCGAYATDITRTVPVSGKFSPRQRELYDIVLGAQRAVLAAVKPGATLPQLTQIAHEYLDSHGKDSKGGPLGKYLTHRVSHGVGLEVHDYPQARSTDPLQAGMVIAIEPGLYLPEENIGIRIEDTVLVTENGPRVLSGALPKEAAEIEKAMAR